MMDFAVERSRLRYATVRLILLLYTGVFLTSLCGCGITRWIMGETGSESLRRGVVKTALSQMGAPYCSGGTSPESGFDCSGFTRWVYGQMGIELPRKSSDQIRMGRAVSRGELKEGDLLFFQIDPGTISHVGIYAGKERFIHCPSTGGSVRRDRLTDRYWERCFAGACTVLP